MPLPCLRDQDDTLERLRQRAAARLLKQRSARCFKRRVCHHPMWVRIGCMRVVHSLYLWADRGVFRLCCSNIHRRANFHQREKFCRSLAFQPNTAVRARRRMYKALMKPVSRSKFAPVTHRLAYVMTARVADCCRDDGISLDTKAVLAGAFVFLFRVN